MRAVIAAALLSACASATSVNDRTKGTDDHPDAAVVTLRDAPQHEDIDAPTQTTPIDAPPGGCTTMTTDLLTNGNFDSSGGWTENPIDPMYPIVSSDMPSGYAPDTAPNAAWLGGFAQSGATDSMYQDVQVPASATALELTGMYMVLTDETGTTAKDKATVDLRTTGGTKIESVQSISNTSTASDWTPLDYTFQNVPAGQTVRLYFTSTNNTTNVTDFFYDSLKLVATHCD